MWTDKVYVENIEVEGSPLITELEERVDKVAGKELSDNNFTQAYSDEQRIDCTEYIYEGEELPYGKDVLRADRQLRRDRINEITNLFIEEGYEKDQTNL